MRFLEAFHLGAATGAIVAFVSAFAVATPLVLLTIRICRRHGWVSVPRRDRWHRGTPASFGGVPIFAGFVTVSLVMVPWSNHLLWKLIAIASGIFLLGLVDDIFHLAPWRKFAGQMIAAGLLVSMGVIYPARGSMTVNVIVSLLWLVGITNAFNLLDNMDGLSAGIAVISAGYLATFYVSSGYPDQAMIVAVIGGTIAGFLTLNFSPARIFMGDCGSLFIGFLLGAMSLMEVTDLSGVPAFVLAPVTVLAIPIFDTLFVSVTRRLRGQAISQGGTDHSSHRLVRLGLTERQAVLLLYGLSATSGTVALVGRHWSFAGAPGLAGFWFFCLFLFGVHLFQDEPQHETHAGESKSFLRRLLSRDMLAFVLDPMAMALAYYLAYALRFRTRIPPGDEVLLLHSLLLVVALKVLSLWICRAFRHSWWRGSITDLYRLACATLLGELLSVLVLTGLYRFRGFSRTVFLLDAVITWGLLLAIRRSFAWFHDTMYTWREESKAQRRVFVLGTSTHAELALRFLRDHRIECAGFIDTNGGADLRRYIFGYPVLGQLDDLPSLSQHHGVFEVVLPDGEATLRPGVDFPSYCQRKALRLTKLGFYESTETPTVPSSRP
jgi:UDP-GlcNAc:undecaprenyl-phosphate/decaprenyl-phosphate GlcNAc-1-phosphate transferase